MIIWPVPRHRLHLHNSRPVSTQPYKGSRMDVLRPPCKPRFLMLHHTPRSAAVHTDLSIHSLNPESAATPSASLPLPDPDNTICRPADPDTSPSACLCFRPHSTIACAVIIDPACPDISIGSKRPPCAPELFPHNLFNLPAGRRIQNQASGQIRAI